jgi:EF-P beta-lysylation protein EpmB
LTNYHWQKELGLAVRDVAELCRILQLPASTGITNNDPILVPRPLIDQMEKGNPNDPLLLQVLPRAEEKAEICGFSRNPLNEFSEIPTDISANSAPNRILKKYSGRSLLLVSNSCGIHCRFCFRRFSPPLGECRDFENVLEPVRADSTVEEIILSGGDPLTLNDCELRQLFQSLLKIPFLKRIRIHTRLPVVLPSRLTSELVEILSLPLPVYLVLHVNHPNELSDDFLARREMLKTPVILSQSVLLRGINDSADILVRLFERLIDHRIIPYYLHQLDRVHGAAHFEVSPEAGLCLMEQLRRRLPGYALPRYVREVPGQMCKTPMEKLTADENQRTI